MIHIHHRFHGHPLARIIDKTLPINQIRGNMYHVPHLPEFDGDQKLWLFGEGGTSKRPTSPGIDAVLFGSKGAWINLPAHSAVEWVELDSSLFAGKTHAYTAFVRGRAGDEREIFSSQFTVPLKMDSSVPSNLIHEAGHAQGTTAP